MRYEIGARAFINQPSSLQPYNKYHGKIGIIVEVYDRVVCLAFCSGKIRSLVIPKECINIISK